MRNKLSTTNSNLSKAKTKSMGWYLLYGYKSICMKARALNSYVATSWCDTNDISQRWYFYSVKGYYVLRNQRYNGYLYSGSNPLYLHNTSYNHATTYAYYYRFRFIGGTRWGNAFEIKYPNRKMAIRDSDKYQVNKFYYQISKSTYLNYWQGVSYTSSWSQSSTSLKSLRYNTPLTIKLKSKNLCLQAQSKGNKVKLFKCVKNKKEQEFRITKQGNYVRIENKHLKVSIGNKEKYYNDNSDIIWQKTSNTYYQYYYIIQSSNTFGFLNYSKKAMRLVDKQKYVQNFSPNWSDPNQVFLINYLKPIVMPKGVPLKKWIRIRNGEFCITQVSNYLKTKLCNRYDNRQLFWFEKNGTNMVTIKNKSNSLFVANNSYYTNTSKGKFYLEKSGKGYRILASNYLCYYKTNQNQNVGMRISSGNEDEVFTLQEDLTLTKTKIPFDKWLSIKNSYSNNCVTATAINGNIYQYVCKKYDERQHWKILMNKNNSVLLENRFFSGYVIQIKDNSYYKLVKKTASSRSFLIRRDKVYNKLYMAYDSQGRCFYVGSTSNGYSLVRQTCNASKYTNFSFVPTPPQVRPPKIYLNRWMQFRDYSNKYCLTSYATSYVRGVACNKNSQTQQWKFQLDKKTGKVYILNRNYKTYLVRNGNSGYFICHNKTYNQPQSQKLFMVKKEGDYFKIINSWGDAFQAVTTNYLSGGKISKTNTSQRIYFKPVVPFVNYNDYKPAIEFNVNGSIRVKGKCLEIDDKDRATFDKCDKNSKNQTFRILGSLNRFVIATGDRQKILKVTERNNGFYDLNFRTSSNWYMSAIKLKYGYYNFRSNYSKECIIAPFSSRLVLSKCHENLQLGKFQFIREGFSPEENKMPNKQYEKRDKVDLKGYYQIRTAKGDCIHEVKRGKKLGISKCKESDRAFFFEIKKDGKNYKLATDSGFVAVTNGTVISGLKGKNTPFRIVKVGGTYMISNDGKKCFTEQSEGGQIGLELTKCNEKNIEQALAIVPFMAYYDN